MPVCRAQMERACVERVDSSLHTLQSMRGSKESEWLVHMLGNPRQSARLYSRVPAVAARQSAALVSTGAQRPKPLLCFCAPIPSRC